MVFFVDLLGSIILTTAILLGIAMIVYMPYWILMKLLGTDFLFPRRNMHNRRCSRRRYKKRYRQERYNIPQENTDTPSAYEVLRCTPNDDDETVKKHYRTLVKQYHPDQLGLGLKNESVLEDAKIKMQQINDAYEAIKRVRGLKR